MNESMNAGCIILTILECVYSSKYSTADGNPVTIEQHKIHLNVSVSTPSPVEYKQQKLQQKK